MKRSLTYLFTMCACLCVGARLHAEVITLQTPNTRLILKYEIGQDLQLLYYGDKSATLRDIEQLSTLNSQLSTISALPAFGTVDMVVLPALQIQHTNGDLSLELAVESVFFNGANSDFDEAVITLCDKLQPVTVRVCYKAWHTVDMIETWTEIEHREKKPIVLKRFDSGTLPIPHGDNWLLHLQHPLRPPAFLRRSRSNP